MGSSASLDRSPRANWVEKAGGLPPYVREVARSIERSRPGMTLSGAIRRAWGLMHRWAAGGDGVKPDTQAKAAKAVAELKALQARNKARQVATSMTHARALDLAARIDAHPLELAVPVPPQFKQHQKKAGSSSSSSGSSSGSSSSGGPPAFVKAKPGAVSNLADLRKAVAAVARLPAERQAAAKASLVQKARGIQGGMAVIPSSWSSSSGSSS